ncbi:MAG: endonuclease/exonuclease/phosphatase family protein [Verrucomicrobiales bacterium]
MAVLLSAAAADEESGDSAPAPAPSSELEIVSFNIRYLNKNEEGENHWRVRKQLTIAAMRAFKADIFGLQEALRSQLDDIAAAFPEYSEFGIGRSDGKTLGEYSPILFRRDRFQLDSDDCGTFWLSDTPEQIGSASWGNKIPRICTWARLTDLESKQSFYVFNTHWDHQSQPSRFGAAKLIKQRIAARKHPTEPVILMGDFNASKDNPAIQALSAVLHDSFAICHPQAEDSGTFHGFRGGKAGKKIDHIFVLPKTRVTSAEILYFNEDGTFPSDHYPVRAALQFR